MVRCMSMELLQIRDANVSDLRDLLDLYRQLSSSAATSAADSATAIFEQFKAYSQSRILVGEIAGVIVTTSAVVVIEEIHPARHSFALIDNVVTHRDFQGRGYGKRMLSAATDTAWAAGCDRVILTAGSANPRVRRLYSKAGFKPWQTGFRKQRPERSV